MGVRQLVYGVYQRRLSASLSAAAVPRHVGVILDGNRRWAKAAGARTAEGHRAGADRILDFLGWCEEAGVERVTLWLLSTDNLSRPPEELADLLEIIEAVVGRLAAARRWRVHPVGALDLLPAATARRLKEYEEASRDVEGIHVNVAIGYGGRREIADAVRSLLHEQAARGTSIEELAEVLDVEH
ncbi:MAG: polyprenyl diphosphate synthase, partial [Kineosporiaceae bacterium]